MKQICTVIIILLSLNVFGQTTVFTDDFNRVSISPGGSPSMTYTTTNTGTGAPVIESSLATGTVPYLKIANGGTGGTNGRSYVLGALSTFSSPFNSTLSSNSGVVTWYCNLRHNRNSTASGFDAGNYGIALVLVASSSNLGTANGYAVVSGGSGTNVYRLVKFTGGLYANSGVTNLVTGMTQTDRRDYMSIKVTYDPLAGTWSYYDRADGPSATPAWTDPSTGTYILRGTSTDASFTGSAMTSFGYLWNYTASGTATNSYFDNFKVTLTPNLPTWTTNWPKADNSTPGGFTARANITTAGATSYYVVLANGAGAPTSAQVKAGQDATGTGVATNMKGTISCTNASTEYTSSVTGLTSGNAYDVYFVAENGSGLQASPVKVAVSALPSLSWTSGWPKAEDALTSSFNVKANLNYPGTSYFVVLATGAAAPSSAQVKAGQDASSGSLASNLKGSISCLTTITEYTSAVTSLSSGTTYDVYFVAEDPIGGNLQASPVKVTQATTSSAVAPSISSPTATSIDNSSAILGGTITLDGGSTITERGTVWKLSTGVTISDNLLTEGGTAVAAFSHTRSSLPAKTQIFYKAYAKNVIGTTLTSESSFYTLANEPANQVAGLTATAVSSTSIDLSWSSVTGADGFIILKRTGSSPPTGSPIDATGYSIGNTIGDGTVAAEVTSGSATSQTISGLSASTAYSFVVMSYNYDGLNYQTINYKTTGTTSATATTQDPPATTYTWNQAGTASFATATNWTPTRTSPATNDVLQINVGGSVVLNGVTAQTIGRLLISNNTIVELQSAGVITLTVGNGSGIDLSIESGSALNLAQTTNAITIALPTGATGSISGTMTFTSAAHKLTAIDASSITFQSGSSFTAGTGFTSNAFGTTALSSVIFASGSSYISYAGANPFGATAPSSVVVWQSGSTYKHRTTGAPSLANRVYANFEFDEATGASLSASSPVGMDNLTVTSGTWTLGVKAQFDIKGNISVASGATLNLTPTTAGTLVFSGTSAQAISCTGTLTTNSFQSFTLYNPNGLTLNTNLSILGSLTFTSGLFNLGNYNLTLGASTTISGTLSATNMIVTNGTGEVRKVLTGAGSFTFPIGDNTVTAEYSPMSVTLTGGSYTSAYVSAIVKNAKHSNNSSSTDYINRYWILASSGITGATYDVTGTYVTADVVGTEANMITAQYASAAWTNLSDVNSSLHTIGATELTSLGDFTAITKPAAGGTVTITLIPEGYYRSDVDPLPVSDVFTATLASATGPDYADVETVNVTIDANTYTGTATFATAATGSYYLYVKGIALMATWSAAPISFVKGGNVNYDYTTGVDKAFAIPGFPFDPMILQGTKWTIYSGDVDQDELIGNVDLTMIDNDAFVTLEVHGATDLDGDALVGNVDLTICDNHAFWVVESQTPRKVGGMASKYLHKPVLVRKSTVQK